MNALQIADNMHGVTLLVGHWFRRYGCVMIYFNLMQCNLLTLQRERGIGTPFKYKSTNAHTGLNSPERLRLHYAVVSPLDGYVLF